VAQNKPSGLKPMIIFNKRETWIIPSVTVILLLAVVLFTGQAAPQQVQPERLSETGASDYDGSLGFGPGPMWFDHARGGRELTADQVRTDLERWLVQIGNPRLKIGNVTEKDSRTITADIVTVDNSLVEKIDIDRHTGIIWQWQQPGFWMSHHWGAPWGIGWGHGMHGWVPLPFFGMFFFFMLIVIVAALISLIFRHRHRGWQDMDQFELSPLDALNKRYAGGEIGRDEYLQRKREFVK
jgi:uncharacterized membrane protein